MTLKKKNTRREQHTYTTNVYGVSYLKMHVFTPRTTHAHIWVVGWRIDQTVIIFVQIFSYCFLHYYHLLHLNIIKKKLCRKRVAEVS